MPLTGLGAIGRSWAINGRFHYQTVWKPAIANPGAAGRFVDASLSSGTPKYNAYAGSQLEGTPMFGSANNGIFTGPDYPGRTKHLAVWNASYSGASQPIPSRIHLCDYVMFYPLIDCDDDTQQAFTNPVGLPRYTSGDGVQMFMVGVVTGVSNVQCTVNYINSTGQSRSTTFTYVAPPSVGVIGSSGFNGSPAFIPLAQGCFGVRSVESVQFAAPAGGFATLVLAKPLVTLSLLETSVAAERTFGPEMMSLPVIEPGAYLNFILSQGANQVGTLRSELVFISD